ncbi:sulfite exporter TauE/SafE family protein [Candidatus Bandiella euplotis]|uniref:sulfite exporter TauE/SafE family protein n=1 Tax=Candidatus Bandiella euplotis TaxID=1664265 RepID=UPI002B2608B4|nr:sulfite exporter TauE/SafE family protein [Candidatus Bandiella woodruffii]
MGIESLTLVLALFVYGVIGSFTHCVGMCGPIVLGQTNMRLMHLNNNQLTNWNKLNCALSMPYYVGKALTYSLLTLAVNFISVSLKENSAFKIAAGILLIVCALIYLQMMLSKLIPSKKLNMFSRSLKSFKFWESHILTFIKQLSLTPFGIKGLFMGMILGLIPCGLVFSAIILVASHQNAPLVLFLAMFFFGLGTFPALFIISLLGQHIMLRAKKWLSFIYALFMFVNFVLLLNFGIKLILSNGTVKLMEVRA